MTYFHFPRVSGSLTPPLESEDIFYQDMGFYLQKERIFPGKKAHKIGAASLGPDSQPMVRTKNFT